MSPAFASAQEFAPGKGACIGTKKQERLKDET
jgi:hypothetical protein